MRSIVQKAYNAFVRPALPRKIGMYNSVAVRYPRLLDMTDTFPQWKSGTIDQVRKQVIAGDHVVDIGTGFGVCAVTAAREGATVNSFEAATGRVEIARETTELNGVEEMIDVTHAIVGEAGEVFGDASGAPIVTPTDLPECDVLVTDCEGAERYLVNYLDDISPDRLVIETHGFAGAPTDEIAAAVRSKGYVVTDIVSPASTHATPEEDNKVIVAHIDDEV